MLIARRVASCGVLLAFACCAGPLPLSAADQEKGAAPANGKPDAEVEKKRLEEAEAAYKQIIEAQTKLAQIYPAEIRYKSDLARNYADLALIQFRARRAEESEATYKQSIQLWEKLVADNPTIADLQRSLVRSYATLASEQLRTGRANEAREIYQLAVAAQEKLAKDTLATREDQEMLATLCFYFGIAQRASGALDEAELMQRKAIELYRKLANLKPATAVYLATALAAYGDTLAMSEKWQEAAAAYAGAIEADGRFRVHRSRRALLLWAAGDAAGYRAACADLMDRFGKIDNPVDAMYVAEACVIGDDALVDMTPVIALAKRAVDANPDSPIAQIILGAAQFRGGQTDEAVATLKAALPKFAVGAFVGPAQRDLLRLSRTLGESCLGMAYQKQGNREGLEKQVATMRKLIELLAASAPPGDDGPFPPWSYLLAVTVGKRELAKLGTATPEQK
jgi:tetratricopeptide (TPR) repeat protein